MQKRNVQKNKNLNIKKNKGIFEKFYPDFMFDRVEDIPVELLKSERIKLLILDMDNTLIDEDKIYTINLKKWMRNVKRSGIDMYILTNSITSGVVKKIAKDFGINYMYNAAKPFLKGYKKIAKITGIEKENIMMIGDQLFTDVWGGKRFGVKTLLVKPIKKQEIFLTRMKRPLERLILKSYEKNK